MIYPRWLMDLAFGYGYPIFNFYPPLAEFLAESLHLIGFNFAAAMERFARRMNRVSRRAMKTVASWRSRASCLT